MINFISVMSYIVFSGAFLISSTTFSQDQTPPGQEPRVWMALNQGNEVGGAWAGNAAMKNGNPWDVKLVITHSKSTDTYSVISFNQVLQFWPEPAGQLTKTDGSLFQFSLDIGTPLEMIYSGTVTGEKFSGTVKWPSKNVSGTFELYRVRDPLVE